MHGRYDIENANLKHPRFHIIYSDHEIALLPDLALRSPENAGRRQLDERRGKGAEEVILIRSEPHHNWRRPGVTPEPRVYKQEAPASRQVSVVLIIKYGRGQVVGHQRQVAEGTPGRTLEPKCRFVGKVRVVIVGVRVVESVYYVDAMCPPERMRTYKNVLEWLFFEGLAISFSILKCLT